MPGERPNPDLLLKELQPEYRKKTGNLKIFFGYAAGVGKTFAMLKAAHQAQKKGIDVVAGYIEPHTRPETMKLLEGLEQLSPLAVQYRGIVLKEFDLDSALARHPQLILVDELAHTNAQGCRHNKRYQDIEELLRAGIDVYTTVNVQHLESLNDVVSSITGVIVNERVPDKIFDAAAQVEVVDIEPADLIDRLEQGKVYRERQAKKALENFFSKKNLAALREIALRRTADRLNRTARESGDISFGSAKEHILICLSAAPSNAKVIRTAARMAEAFHGSFTALFVEKENGETRDTENARRLKANLKLATDLGAKIATVYGDDVALQIAEYAKAGGVTKIVIGRTNTKKGLFSRKNLIDRLTEITPNQDIYVIPDHQPPYRPQVGRTVKKLSLSAADFLKMGLVLGMATLAGLCFYNLGLGEANIITIYILGVLLVSVWTNGSLYGALASMLSVLLFNFFFTVPRFSLQAYDPGYPITFLIMLVSSFITSSLTMRVKIQAGQASRKAYWTEVLLETSRKLQKAAGAGEIIGVTAKQMMKLSGRTVVFYQVKADGSLTDPAVFPIKPGITSRGSYTTVDERAVAQWVGKNNKHAGATTKTLPSAKCLYLAVRGQERVFAVAGIAMDEDRDLDSFEKNLLIAMLDECGLALEKEKNEL